MNFGLAAPVQHVLIEGELPTELLRLTDLKHIDTALQSLSANMSSKLLNAERQVAPP